MSPQSAWLHKAMQGDGPTFFVRPHNHNDVIMYLCSSVCPPPPWTVEEGRFWAVYTVNGQELSMAFFLAADTQKHCSAIAHISKALKGKWPRSPPPPTLNGFNAQEKRSCGAKWKECLYGESLLLYMTPPFSLWHTGGWGWIIPHFTLAAEWPEGMWLPTWSFGLSQILTMGKVSEEA